MAYSGLMIILKGSARGEVVDAAGRRRIIDNISVPQLIAPAFIMQDNTIVLSNFIDIISNRANYFSRKIYTLSVLMLTEKVAALLLSLATDGDTVPMQVDKMTDELNITRNALEQTLTELAKRGYIELSETQIVLRNRKALETMVGQQ